MRELNEGGLGGAREGKRVWRGKEGRVKVGRRLAGFNGKGKEEGGRQKQRKEEREKRRRRRRRRRRKRKKKEENEQTERTHRKCEKKGEQASSSNPIRSFKFMHLCPSFSLSFSLPSPPKKHGK